MAKNKEKPVEEEKVPKYIKKEILKSKQFDLVSKDLLAALLEDTRQYGLEEVKELLDKEMKRVVK